MEGPEAPLASKRSPRRSHMEVEEGGQTKNKKDNGENVEEGVESLLRGQVVLCSLPILLLVTVASLDNADKQLLASSFPMLERTLKLDVKTLGYFSLCTNLSYALSLPFWGFMVHKYGLENIHNLLSAACVSWGLTTLGIAFAGSSIVFQAVFRAMNGVALASILPLSQTLLVELVPVSMRGRAFGFMGLCEKLAGTLAASSIVYFETWQNPYYILGLFSTLMALVARDQLSPRRRQASSLVKKNDGEDVGSGEKVDLTYRQIIQRIARIPAFSCMVIQGCFGGTPWDMMSFMLLLLDWRGFSKEQIVSIQFSMGISGTIGGWLGGILGDYTAQSFATVGRVYVAFVSVAGGIPLYGFFLYATDYKWAMLWINLFSIWGSWTPAAALRPLCADLARNPSERAQIVSMWIVLEKTSGAIFGAPLVGYLTSNMLGKHAEGDIVAADSSSEKAQALAFNLFGLSSFFWGVCAVVWLVMAYTIGPSNQSGRSGSTLEDEEKERLMV